MCRLLAILFASVVCHQQLLGGDNVIVGPDSGKRLGTTISRHEPQWQLKHASVRLHGLVHRWTPKEDATASDTRSGSPPGPPSEVLVQMGDHGSAEAASKQLRVGIELTSFSPSRVEKVLGDAPYVW